MNRDDRRRNQKSWQELLQEGKKQRVMLKGALTPPTLTTVGDETTITPTYVDVWIIQIDDTYEPTTDEKARKVYVSDEVVKVAVFDPSLPGTVAPTGKTGAYGHIELIDGIYELTWVGC